MKRASAVRRTLTGVFTFLLCVATARADTPDQVRQELVRTLIRHTIYVRQAYQASYLRFDEQGKLLNHVEPGSWTDTGAIYPTKIEMSSTGLLHIEAQRVAVAFDQTKATWQTIRRESVPVVVEVQFSQATLTVESAQRTINAVFAKSLEELTPALPKHWQPCTSGVLQHDPVRRGRVFCFDKNVTPDMVSHAPVATDAIRETGSVSPARPVEAPIPKFTDVARELRFNGSSILWVVLNEMGRAEQIYVVSPAGYGLDDEAVKAISKWEFSPAVLNGKPVRVQTIIEVNFKVPRYKPPRH